MGAVRSRQAAELEDVIDNFPVRIELSHPISRDTEGLDVDRSFIDLFTDEGVPESLAVFLRNVGLLREFVIYDPTSVELYLEELTEWIIELVSLQGEIPGDFRLPPFQPLPLGQVSAITPPGFEAMFDTLTGVYIEFFYEHDASVFDTSEHVAVVCENILSVLAPDSPVLTITVWQPDSDDMGIEIWDDYAGMELQIVGVIHGAEDIVLVPYWTASELWESATGLPPFSILMNALMSDNRLLDEFKVAARTHFVSAGIVERQRPHALTVFDGMYNDVVRTLRQNISLIDTATPFVFALTVCIGFVASFLLTRRRKPEFAVMRSIGVRKADVFMGALAEQGLLCLIGAAAGCVLFLVIWGEVLLIHAAVFTVCYVLGSAFSAARAAGTDVLKVLREKE